MFFYVTSTLRESKYPINACFVAEYIERLAIPIKPFINKLIIILNCKIISMPYIELITTIYPLFLFIIYGRRAYY